MPTSALVQPQKPMSRLEAVVREFQAMADRAAITADGVERRVIEIVGKGAAREAMPSSSGSQDEPLIEQLGQVLLSFQASLNAIENEIERL